MVADIGFGPLGLGICYDLRFAALVPPPGQGGGNDPEAPACFTRQTGQAHWHVLVRARAIENGAFVIAAAQGGRHEDGRESYGHSIVVDPWGAIVAELDHDEPGVLVCEIDLAAVETARNRVPSLRNERDFGLIIVESAGLAGNSGAKRNVA